MGKVIHKEITGETQTIIEFESYQDFKDWYKVGSESVVSVSDPQFDMSKYLEGGGFKDINKLDIDWDDINPRYKWAAMDYDGAVCIYDTKPVVDVGWNHWDNDSTHTYLKLSKTPPKEFWKETLTKRPEGV